MNYIWNLDPVAFSLFGLDVRWYGLAYGLGALFSIWLGNILQKKMWDKPVPKDNFENLVLGMFLCGVLGGRVFEMFFYRFGDLIADPIEMVRVWNGGMSIHGGMLGGLAFAYWWSRKHKVPFVKIMDVAVLPLAFVMIFGRLANWMNGELWGRPTGANWGVIFPHVDDLLRHPSQIYEATKNAVMAGILAWGIYKQEWYKTPGRLSAFFLIWYGTVRGLIEAFFREPSGYILDIFPKGQFLGFFMIGLGIWLLVRTKHTEK
jgi:phosphatidylglycerol:prolipoprotein diacylglycerol transferase